MTEQFANFAQSSLARACGTNDTTIYIAPSSPIFSLTPSFPASGNFRIVVQIFDASRLTPISAPEIMIVTAVGGNGTVFTVERGQENTKALAFSSGAKVTHIVTAGVMQALQAGSGGGGASVIAVNSFPYTASATAGITSYNIYANSIAVAFNLPATPAQNEIARIMDAGNTSGTQPITINGNGNNIVAYGSGTNSSIQINSNGGDKWLAWDGNSWA